MKLTIRRYSLAITVLALSALPAGAATFACGDVIGPGKAVTVDNDLFDCPEFGLRIVGPVSVDLGASFVVCDPDASTAGLQIDGSGVKVRGGRVVDCTVGVQLLGEKHRVSGVFIERAFIGVSVQTAGRSRIEGNQIDEADFGISMLSVTERNQVLDNELDNVALVAIEVDGERHKVARNVVQLAGHAAFSVGGSGHKLIDNIGRSLEIAYSIRGEGHKLDGNSALFTGDGSGQFDGIGFHVNGERITLIGNSARRNFETGFVLSNSTRLRVERNEAEQNGFHGFLVSRVSDSVLRKNEALSNFDGDGIHVEASSTRNILSGNTATGHDSPSRDLRDNGAECVDNRWQDNTFTTAFPSCIR